MNFFLLGAEVAGDGLSWSTIATQVPLVILALPVFWAFYKMWFVAGPIHQREVDRAQDAWNENQRLRDTLENKVLPALIRSSDLTEEAVRVLESTVDMLGRASDGVETLRDLYEETRTLHDDTRLIHERVVAALKSWE